MAGPSLRAPIGYPHAAAGGPSMATAESLGKGDEVWGKNFKSNYDQIFCLRRKVRILDLPQNGHFALKTYGKFY